MGKVTLKKAVGRVRGMGSGAEDKTGSSTPSSSLLMPPSGAGVARMGIVGGGLSGIGATSTSSGTTAPARRNERREAILNGSRGLRAQEKQALRRASSSPSGKPSSSSGNSGKLAQLRNDTKVATTWSKGNLGAVKKISHKTPSSFSSSSFGASVAFASGKVKTADGSSSNRRIVGKLKQVQVQLQHGKQLRLPSSAAAACGMAKTKGVFSSLSQKMKQSDRASKKGSGSSRR